MRGYYTFVDIDDLTSQGRVLCCHVEMSGNRSCVSLASLVLFTMNLHEDKQ